MKSAYPPSGEKADDPKSSSVPAEEGKSSGSGWIGPTRRLSQKTTAVAKDEYEQFSDEVERGALFGHGVLGPQGKPLIPWNL